MPAIQNDPFVLVDGSSYLFRAYHALPPLSTATGQPTGAIYGVINMLRKLLAAHQPTRIAIVFDSKTKNFRHALYPAYKANRTVMPEDLATQIEPLQAIIKAMGLALVVIPGIEADDIIGTLAYQAKAKGLETLISSGDKDFIQLVDADISLMNTMKDELLDPEAVLAKLGITPLQMIDYLTLIGDSVDNIPGVPGVGPKTAVKWLSTYGSLQGLVAAAADIPGKVGEALRANLDQLPLFEQLVTIKTDVDLEYTLDDFRPQPPNAVQLAEWFQRLEFKAWLKELHQASHHVDVAQKKPEMMNTVSNDAGSEMQGNILDASSTHYDRYYETILSEQHFDSWLDRLKSSDFFAFDTETTSLDYMSAQIVGLSFALVPGEAAYVPLCHDYEGAPTQLNREWVLAQLKPLLENTHPGKIGHNLKYDAEVLANHGIALRGIAFDTMLASYVLGSTLTRHNLEALAKKYLHCDSISFESLAGSGKNQLTFNQIPIEAAAVYAAEDADLTIKLHDYFEPKLQTSPEEQKVFEQLDMPLVPVLVSMERLGVLIDPIILAEQGVALEARMRVCEEQIYLLSQKTFNINSPKQLQEVLYQDLKLPILAKTPGGQASTAEAVLEELSYQFELPKIILEYRSLGKLKSTYVDKLPGQINPHTGRVHTSYHQAVTSTGRLSCSDPNLQNIPIRTPEGRKIRRAFIAPESYQIVSADYSQIELRILAHLSQDPGLLKAFSLGDDIHRNTAAAVWDLQPEAVTAEQRRSAKAINFGLMYGMSAFGLSKQLGIPVDVAQRQVDRYFDCFSGVKQFMAQLVAKGVSEGYVQTMQGRRLYLPDLKNTNVSARRAAERAAVNAPMQGTNADIIKAAMIALEHWMRTEALDMAMIMQVHDELVFEVSEAILPQAIVGIRKLMEGVCTLSVPLKVDIGVGSNWDEAH